MLGFISGERGRCGVLWTSGTMNSGHVAERVCVHVCTSGCSKRDFVLLELLILVVSTNTTITEVMLMFIRSKSFCRGNKMTVIQLLYVTHMCVCVQTGMKVLWTEFQMFKSKLLQMPKKNSRGDTIFI